MESHMVTKHGIVNRIVGVCGINGCLFEGNRLQTNFHQQEVHKIDVHGDGKKVRGVQRMKPTSCK
jgi:hypothetical protein